MHAHSHAKQTLSMPTQTARKKEAAYTMTPIRDSTQELRSPSGVIKSSTRSPTSSPKGETIRIRVQTDCLDWNGLVREKDIEQLVLDESQGHIPPTKHDAPLREFHREQPHLHCTRGPAIHWEQPCGAMRAAKTHLAPPARIARRGAPRGLRLSLDPAILLPLSVAALDQVDGIERAVDRVIAPKEEARQRHHLAATIG